MGKYVYYIGCSSEIGSTNIIAMEMKEDEIH